MVQTPAKRITLENFLQLPEHKPAQEFVDGQIIQKPMPKGEHSRLQQKLSNAINAVVEDDSVALALPELRCTFGGRSIVPDIAVFTWERIPTRPDGTIASDFESHPDWVIEILSPNQSATRVTDNILHCLNHGTQLGWLLDPLERLVLVYPPEQQARCYRLSEENLPVPNFAVNLDLTVGKLFGWLRIKQSPDIGNER